MAKVGIALSAAYFRAAHEEGPVVVLGHSVVAHRLIETRPAGARVEFRIRREKWRTAAHASKNSLALLMIEGARTGPLGAVLARDFVLFRRQLRPPFRIALLDPLCHNPTLFAIPVS